MIFHLASDNRTRFLRLQSGYCDQGAQLSPDEPTAGASSPKIMNTVRKHISFSGIHLSRTSLQDPSRFREMKSQTLIDYFPCLCEETLHHSFGQITRIHELNSRTVIDRLPIIQNSAGL